jgi:hypothetical protein
MLTLFSPGARMVYQGQCDGFKLRVPVQLNRLPNETINDDLRAFYDELLPIVQNEIDILPDGQWEQIYMAPQPHLDPLAIHNGDTIHHHIIENPFVAYRWQFPKYVLLILTNYSDSIRHGLIKPQSQYPILQAILDKTEIVYKFENLNNNGMALSFHPFETRILKFQS